MATETLDDTKPKQVENEAKDEPKPKEEVEVTEQDAEIAESDEKKEIDEHEDSEKDDEDEGGDEDDADADADDEEEEDAGEEKEKKGVKKEASSEKKSPVTPTSDRPTRERKTVERYSEPSPSKFGRSSSSKGLIIEKVCIFFSQFWFLRYELCFWLIWFWLFFRDVVLSLRIFLMVCLIPLHSYFE